MSQVTTVSELWYLFLQKFITRTPFWPKTHIPWVPAKSCFLNFLLCTILQNYHLHLDLGSEWCPHALSPLIMVTVIFSFRLVCVFPSINLQLTTHQSWSIQVMGWLLISMLWWSDFLRGFHLKRLVSNVSCCCWNIWPGFHQCSAQQ